MTHPKTLATFAGLSIVAAIGIAWIVSIGKTVAYVAHASSSQWPRYASSQHGFSIKYPTSQALAAEDPKGVDFRVQDDSNLSVRLEEESMQQFIERTEKRSVGTFRRDHVHVKINGLDARRMTGTVGFFDSAGSMAVELLLIPRGSSTYVISWTLGRGPAKNSQTLDAIYREMIGTFELTEIKRSDRLTYADADHRFSFDYPTQWRVVRGSFPTASVYSGMDYRISIFVYENTSLQEFRRQQGDQLSDVGQTREFFSHHLVGHKCSWLGRETYVFEKGERLYVVLVDHVSNDRKVVEDILESFAL